MNGDTLEKFYQEGLEERLIIQLAKVKKLTLEQAMDIYYRSRLAQKIHDGTDDVQYLDYKVLVQILLDTEPELFETIDILASGGVLESKYRDQQHSASHSLDVNCHPDIGGDQSG